MLLFCVSLKLCQTCTTKMSCNTTTSLAGSQLTSWEKRQTEISKEQPYSHSQQPRFIHSVLTFCLMQFCWKLASSSSCTDGVWPHLQWMPITTPPRMRWYFLLASFKPPSTVMPGQSKRAPHIPRPASSPYYWCQCIKSKAVLWVSESLLLFSSLGPWILVELVSLWVMSWLMHLMIKVTVCNDFRGIIDYSMNFAG